MNGPDDVAGRIRPADRAEDDAAGRSQRGEEVVVLLDREKPEIVDVAAHVLDGLGAAAHQRLCPAAVDLRTAGHAELEAAVAVERPELRGWGRVEQVAVARR